MQVDTTISDDGKSKQDPFSPSLKQSIEKLIKREGFLKYKTYRKQISTLGNYLGELHLVDVKGETTDGEKETNIFVKKIAPMAAENMKDHLLLENAFESESYFYTELSRIYTDLQNEANIPKDDRCNLVKGYDESSPEAIILDNIAVKGFKPAPRLDVITLAYAELTIEQLARFHGLSFVLEKRKPAYFGKKVASIKIPFTWSDSWRDGTRNVMVATPSNMTDDVYRKKAEDFIEPALDKFIKHFEEHRTPIRCLCHGDFRASNVLVRENNGVLTEVMPVDYQHIHYGCPVNDFIFFVYLGSDRQFRKQHLEHLKDLYFTTLRRFLLYFHLDAEEIFPRKQFDNIFLERLDQSLVVALFFIPLIFTKEDDVIDVGKESVKDWRPTLDDRFEDRVKGIIDELIENGFDL